MFISAVAPGIVLAGLLATSASAETIRFRFAGSDDASAWSPITQTWKVRQGKGYRPVIDRVAFPASILDKSSFTDVEATFKIDTIARGKFAGGLVRARAKGRLLYGYVAYLSNWDGEKGSLEFGYFNGIDLHHAQGHTGFLCGDEVDLGKAHAITIKAEGEKLEVFYNGALVCAASDDRFSKGSVALFTDYDPDGPAFFYKSVTIETP
jgi:hypothetical protein